MPGYEMNDILEKFGIQTNADVKSEYSDDEYFDDEQSYADWN